MHMLDCLTSTAGGCDRECSQLFLDSSHINHRIESPNAQMLLMFVGGIVLHITLASHNFEHF